MCDEDPKGPGFFCWNELVTRNPEQAKAFYGRVFGWEHRDFDSGPVKYTVFKKDGKDVAGMVQIKPEWGNAGPAWLSYVQVQNLDEMVKKVEENRGKVVMPPKDIPDVGRFAVILDPEGVQFAMIEPKE